MNTVEQTVCATENDSDLRERIQAEESALRQSTRLKSEENALLEERIASTRKQNVALASLIREQETYLAEVEAQVALMEARRREWRRRYSEVTGRSLDEPVAAGP